jgi:L-asparagine oxygenase
MSIQSHIVEFTPEDIEIFKKLADQIITSPSEYPNIFCSECKHASHKIPLYITRILNHFVKHGTDTGFLLIKNFPVDDSSIPPTPSIANYPNKIGETTSLARVQCILLSAISEMIAYEAEGDGRLFQDVVPIQSMEKQQTSLSSNVELEIHTEQAFSQLRPDILSLACLRGDPNAYTYVLPVHNILDNVTPFEKKMLATPLWKTGVDLSFKLHNSEFIDGDVRGPLPIIYGSASDPFLLFDQDLMSGETTRANELIQDICRIYYKNRIEYSLEPGDIILIDNRRAVHGRSSYSPKYDGTDRFLIRCFSTLDYDKSDYARKDGGRMVSAIYS